MKSHFLKDVEFINFKCFKALKVKNFKRVNLVSGKNNIGKTSLLEGLEMLLKSKTAFGLRMISSNILRRRQAKKTIHPHQSQSLQEIELDFFADLQLGVILKSADLVAKLTYVPIGEEIKSNNIQSFSTPIGQDFRRQAPFPFMEFSFGNDTLAAPVQDMTNTIFQMQDVNHVNGNINFISSCATDEMSLAAYYGKLMISSQEDYLNKSLKQFDENISELKAIPVQGGTIFKLRLVNRDQLILLSSMGEGINRYIAILCAIWASKDGYLFIDEIENGIHYTNYKKLWQIIFEASKMANCQIFVTSHSKECIEAFNEINTDNEGIYLEFYRNQKTDLITVNERDSKQLNYALTHGGSVRGE